MAGAFPKLVYILMLILFSGELIAGVLKKKSIAGFFGILGLLTGATGVGFIFFSAGRPPLYGPFEASVYIAFILALLSRIYSTKPLVISSMIILVLLLIQIRQPMALNVDYYMYDHIWVIIFFNLRLTAGAFFLQGMALSLSGFFAETDRSATLSRHGGIHLLTGAVIYLCSEWSGSLWCLNWFGDSWHWSSGFIKASMLFLLVMLSCHLPMMFGNNRWARAVFGAFPGCFTIWLIFFR